MELSDILSIIISAAATLIALMAYWRSRLADEANAKYEAIRERLAEVELQRVESASIHLDFTETYHGQIHLVIRNEGPATAHNVNVNFDSVGGGALPPGLENIDPISKLAQGHPINIPTVLGTGLSGHLKGMWSWENPDGRKEERESEFRLF